MASHRPTLDRRNLGGKLLNAIHRTTVFVSLLALACGGCPDESQRGGGGGGSVVGGRGGGSSVVGGRGGSVDYAGGGDGQTTDLVSVTLKAATDGQTSSSSAAFGMRQQALTASDGPCRLGELAGYCLAPANLGGQVGAIWLTEDRGGPPHRILGHSVNLGLDRDGRFEIDPFDFAHPTPIPGDPALTDLAPGARLVSIGMNLAELDLQANVVPGETWNFKLAFVTQPLSDEPAVAACLASNAPYAARIASNTVLTPGLAPHRGDILLCKKPSPSDVCAPADYQFIDAASGALSAKRPAAPLSFADALKPPRCGVSDGRPDIDAYGHTLSAALRTPLTLWGRYESCYQRFYTAADRSGTKMNVELSFDSRGFLFFRGLESIQGKSEAELLKALVPQSIVWDQRHPMGHGDTSLEVVANVSLSEAKMDCRAGGGGSGGSGPGSAGRGATVDPNTVDRDIDDDGMYTCLDFCHESSACEQQPAEGCNMLCGFVAEVNTAGACTSAFSALLACKSAQAACRADCATEDEAWSGCMKTHCASHMSSAGCQAIAQVMAGGKQ